MADPRTLLQLSALLQDVGDVVALASSATGAAQDHRELGANWLQAFVALGLPQEVAQLVRSSGSRDGEHGALAALACHADRLVRGQEPSPPAPAEGEQPSAERPGLRSIFSTIGGEDMGISPQTDSALTYPAARPAAPQGATLVAAFGEAFRRWVQAGCGPDALLEVLERHWGCMPAGAGMDGVSLFDAARLKCAVASCMYERLAAQGLSLDSELPTPTQPDDEPQFCLVGGRLVGGQTFVERSVLRGDVCSLLGRAFFARLLTEHVADDLLGRLGLCRANALYRTDAEFVLLCPNTPAVGEAMGELVPRLDRWLLDVFGPAMHWAVGAAPLAGRDFAGGGFAQALRELDCALEAQEARPFSTCMVDTLAPQPPANAEEACHVCGRDADPELAPLSARTPDVKACARCRQLDEIGARLMGALGVTSEPAEPDGDLLCFPQADGAWRRYAFASSGSEPGTVNLDYVFADVAHASGRARPMFFARYIRSAAHLPKAGRTGDKKRRHEPATLRALAKSARGAARLGALRLDVDDTRTQLWRSATGLAQFAALARTLTRFFDVHAPAICAARLPAGLRPQDISGKMPDRGVGRNLTLVRSTGGALLLLGAWDEVAEVALDFAECFRRYAAGGALTVSAAVTLDEPGASVAEMTQAAAHGLTLAKASGRGRCALFHAADALLRPAPSHAARMGRCCPWAQLHELVVDAVVRFKRGGRIAQNRLDLRLPSGFTQRLLQLLDQWERDGALSLPRLAHLAKLLRERGGGEAASAQALLMDASKLGGLAPAVIWLELLIGKS